MLKAFSKVFHHKPQSQLPPGVDGTTESAQQKHTGELPSHTKHRTLERKRVSGLGLDSNKAGGASGREESVGSGLPKHAPNQQQRSYQKHQQIQPRLHIKSSSSAHAPDGSGRFPLTKENLEWHQRMLPPVKDCKYNRIVRYIQEQQQNVAAAAADPIDQQLDIDASMLMSGQMQHEYNQPQDPYLLQQTYQVSSNHSYHPYQFAAQGAGNMYSMVGNNPATTSSPQHMPVDSQFAQNNGGRYVSRSTSNGRMHPHLSQTAAIDQMRGLSRDKEDEDNTPLAAISISTSPRQQPVAFAQPPPPLPPPKAPARPDNLDIVPGSSLEKYMTDSLNDPLPEPISPTKGSARMSMMSFQSNMAVNLNPSEHISVSRTHSLSNARSPITRESLPDSANSGSNGQRRPSLLTANVDHEAATPRPTIEENVDDDEPLVKQQQRGLERKVTDGADSGKAGGINDMDSEPEIALRVVNGTESVHDSDKSVSIKQSKAGEIEGVGSGDEDEDDNKPLMSLTGNIGLKNQDAAEIKELKVVNTAVAATDDDDDQPLSNLLAQSAPPHQNKHFGNDGNDVGSLPLPAPRRVVDPDTVDDVNEGPASLGHRLSENSAIAMSLRRSTSSARQRSSLRSAVPIFADEDVASNAATSSMAVAVNSDYSNPRNNNTLSEISSGAVMNTNPRPTTQHSTQPSNLSGLSIQLAVKSRRSNSITRSVNLDGSVSPFEAQQRLPGVLEDATNEAIAEDSEEEMKRNKDTSITLAMLESGAADVRDSGDESRDSGKPWMFTRGYSESATSLNSNRRAMRGSTLGQQLADELHMLREGIARSQKEKEKADRRSWQIGALPTAISRPWLRNENVRSDPALPERRQVSQTMVNFQDSSDSREQRPITSSGIGQKLAHTGSSKSRPISIQPKRASRWFASNKKVISGKEDNVSLSDMAAASVDVDVDGQSTSTGGEFPKSLSSRINSKFGRLKRTFNS